MFNSASHYITRRPKLGPIDAQVVYPLLVFMLHPRQWTAIIFMMFIVFLWYISTKGVDIKMMFRITRRFFTGNRREIRSSWRVW